VSFADRFFLLAVALLLDAIVGDPDWVWRRIPHPVVLVGRLIGILDVYLNREAAAPGLRRTAGVVALAIVVLLAGSVGIALQALLAAVPFGWIATAIVAGTLLSGRSLYDHVAAVGIAFRTGGIDAARAAVSRIVGRDPANLDEAGVSRAAIESTAENFSDGVVAPAFWFLVLGLPGLLAYKAINTADSMIGHRNDRYRDFGWAAARLDDLVNLPASRIAGALLCLASPVSGGSITRSAEVMFADAGRHRSPNAGWPEAAIAAGLGLALAGPRTYGGVIVNDAFLNERGRREARPEDISRALRVYVAANAVLFALVALGSVLALAL
jgi:adenosylcobinamide-phosphate synthase